MEEPIRLLLIDDEDYVIEGLKKHIDWSAIGIEVVGSAGNGMEGLREIAEKKPDIVLVDVRMPIMDGIAMIEQVHQSEDAPCFIILSGFDDFEFARRAIRFDVIDYILKPSLPDEISHVVEKTADKCRMSRQLRKEQELQKKQFREFLPIVFNTFIKDLLKGRITSKRQFEKKCEFLSLNITESAFCIATLFIDDASSIFSRYTEEQEQYVLYAIADYSARAFQLASTYTSFSDYFSNFIIPVSQDSCIMETLKLASQKIISFCNNTYKICATIGLSPPVKDFSQIPIAYEQSMECVKYSLERNICVSYLETCLESDGSSPFLRFPSKEIIIEAIRSGDTLAVLSALKDLFVLLDNPIHRNRQNVLPLLYELVGATAAVLSEMGIVENYNQLFSITSDELTLSEIESRLMQFYKQTMDKVENVVLVKNPQVVRRILEIASEHYREGITLNEISDTLNLTPNYLSAVFSKSMGQSFSSYITHYRIQQAKKLLTTRMYRIQEVAALVGYSDPVYFSKIFKDIVGLTPSGYTRQQ